MRLSRQFMVLAGHYLEGGVGTGTNGGGGQECF